MPRRTTRRTTRHASRRRSTEPSEPEASDTEEVGGSTTTKDDTAGEKKEAFTPKRRGGGISTRSASSKVSTRKRKRGGTSDAASDEDAAQDNGSSEDDKKGGGTTGDEMSISSKGTISKGSKASVEMNSEASEESEEDSKQRRGRSSGGKQRSTIRPHRKKKKSNDDDEEEDVSSNKIGSKSNRSTRRSSRRTRISQKEEKEESSANGEDNQESSNSSENEDTVPSTKRSTRRTQSLKKEKKKPSSSEEDDEDSSESSEDEEVAFRRSYKTGEINPGNIVSGRRRARSKYASEDDSVKRPATGTNATSTEKRKSRTKRAKVGADEAKERSSGVSGDDESSTKGVAESRNSEVPASKGTPSKKSSQDLIKASSKSDREKLKTAEPYNTVSEATKQSKESSGSALATENVPSDTTASPVDEVSASSPHVPSHEEDDEPPESIANTVQHSTEKMEEGVGNDSGKGTGYDSGKGKPPVGDVVRADNVRSPTPQDSKAPIEGSETALDLSDAVLGRTATKETTGPSPISQVDGESSDLIESKAPNCSRVKSFDAEEITVPKNKAEDERKSLDPPQESFLENSDTSRELLGRSASENLPEKSDAEMTAKRSQIVEEPQSTAIDLNSTNDTGAAGKGTGTTSKSHSAAAAGDRDSFAKTTTPSASPNAEPPINLSDQRDQEGATGATVTSGSVEASVESVSTAKKIVPGDQKSDNASLSSTTAFISTGVHHFERNIAEQGHIKTSPELENIAEKQDVEATNNGSQAQSSGAPSDVNNPKQSTISQQEMSQTLESTPDTIADSSVILVNETPNTLENSSSVDREVVEPVSKVSIGRSIAETERPLKTEPTKQPEIVDASPNKPDDSAKSVDERVGDNQINVTEISTSGSRLASTSDSIAVPVDTVDSSVVKPMGGVESNAMPSSRNVGGSSTSAVSIEVSTTARPNSSIEHASTHTEWVTQSMSNSVEADKSPGHATPTFESDKQAEALGAEKVEQDKTSVQTTTVLTGPIPEPIEEDRTKDAGIVSATSTLSHPVRGETTVVDATSDQMDVEPSDEGLIKASTSTNSVPGQGLNENPSSSNIDTDLGKNVNDAAVKPSDSLIVDNAGVSVDTVQGTASVPPKLALSGDSDGVEKTAANESSTQSLQGKHVETVELHDSSTYHHGVPRSKPIHRPVVNGVIPTIFSSEQVQKLQLIRQQPLVESDTKENTDFKSNSSPVSFPIILEEVSSRGVTRSPREKLESSKLRVLREAQRVHGAKIAERLFAEYWSCILEQIHGLGGSDKLKSFLNRFLCGKSLRRAHNKLILAIVKQCESATAAIDEIFSFIPDHLKCKVKRVHADAAATTSDNDTMKLDLSQLHLNTRVDKEPLVAIETRSTAHVTPATRNRIQLRIPGALAIDPVVRAAAMQESLKVSETVVWLLVVAAKEYATQIIKSCANVKKAACQGIHLRVPQPRPHTLMYKPKPGELKRHNESTRKPIVTGSLCISSFDVHTLLAQLPMGPIHSIGGTVSRMSYETTLMNCVDMGESFTPDGFEELQHFIVSRTLSRKASTGPVPGSSAGRVSPHGGLGRGAKDLASLRARSTATLKPSSFESNKHAGGTSSSQTLQSEENGDKQSDSHGGVRKGKGSGVKNLRAMIARNQPANPSDNATTADGSGDTSSRAVESTPTTTGTHNT